jgi:hypothetical protein
VVVVHLCLDNSLHLLKRFVNGERAHGAGHILYVEDGGLGGCGKRGYRQADKESGKKSTQCWFLSTIENRQDPRAGDETERYRHQDPKEDSLYVSCAVRNTVILLRTALGDEIQLPKGESNEQNRQYDEDGAVRFESSQVSTSARRIGLALVPK